MRIRSEGFYSFLETQNPTEKIAFNACREEFSYLDPDRFMSKAFQKKWWDGRVHFITEKGRFLRGLSPRIAEWLQDNDIKVEWDSEASPYNLIEHANKNCLDGITLWDHQLRSVKATLPYLYGTVNAVTGSGKTESISAIAKIALENTDKNVFFLVHRTTLIHQTYKRFCERVPHLKKLCGRLGDGYVPDPSNRLVFSTYQSLSSKLGLSGRAMDETVLELWGDCGFVLIDECHRVAENAFQKLLSTLPDQSCVYQFSGTPEVDDIYRDTMIEGVGGPQRCKVGRKELEKLGILAEAVAMLKVFGTKPKRGVKWVPEKLDGDSSYVEAYNVTESSVDKTTVEVPSKESKQNISDLIDPSSRLLFPGYARDMIVLDNDRNNDLLEFCVESVRMGRNVVVLCERVAQVLLLKHHFESKSDLSVGFVHGEHSTKQRQQAAKDFESGKFSVLLASSIFDEGVDIQGVGSVALAGGGMSLVRVAQRIGRGVRKKKGVKNVVPVWTPIDVGDRFNKSHSMQRLDYFERCELTSKLVEKTWREEISEVV